MSELSDGLSLYDLDIDSEKLDLDIWPEFMRLP